jgi:cell division protein FtsL
MENSEKNENVEEIKEPTQFEKIFKITLHVYLSVLIISAIGLAVFYTLLKIIKP